MASTILTGFLKSGVNLDVANTVAGYLDQEISASALIERLQVPANLLNSNAPAKGSEFGAQLQNAIIHAAQDVPETHNALLELLEVLYTDSDEDATGLSEELQDHHDCEFWLTETVDGF